MGLRRFIRGLLWLLGLPLVIILGLIGYSNYFTPPSSVAKQESFYCEVEPKVIYPWQDNKANYQFIFNGDHVPLPVNAEKVSNIDLIFVIDTSISMGSTLPAMLQAAQHSIESATGSLQGNIRFSLMSFADSATILVPWTADTSQLKQQIASLSSGGGTNGSAIFPSLEQLFNARRPDAKTVAIFYTDGMLGFQASLEDPIIQNARNLREQGLDIYAVIPPNFYADTSSMAQMTGSDSQVLSDFSIDKLANVFQQVLDNTSGLIGDNASISYLADTQNFTYQFPTLGAWREQNGTIKHNIGNLPARNRYFSHHLSPQSQGLWSLGLNKAQLQYSNPAGELLTETCERPTLLVLSWWIFILWLIPVLLWIISYWMNRGTDLPPKPPKIAPLKPIKMPDILPIIEKPYQGLTEIPTLFISIGRVGYDSVQAIQKQLLDIHIDIKEPKHEFLHIDISQIPHQTKLPITQAIINSDALQLNDYVHNAILKGAEKHLAWMNFSKYKNEGSSLNLNAGVFERDLARLALFRCLELDQKNSEELNTTSGLLHSLQSKYKSLLRYPSIGEKRQIIILADRTETLASSCVLDIGRILRRIIEDYRQKNNQAYRRTPDVIALLSQRIETTPTEKGNRYALDSELETANLCGAYPIRTTYVNNHPILDQVDNVPIFNWIFSVDGEESSDVNHQIASFCNLILKRKLAAKLLNNLHACPIKELINPNNIISNENKCIHYININDVYTPVYAYYQLARFALFNKLLNSGVLIKDTSTKKDKELLVEWRDQARMDGVFYMLLHFLYEDYDENLRENLNVGKWDAIRIKEDFYSAFQEKLCCQDRWCSEDILTITQYFSNEIETHLLGYFPKNKEVLSFLSKACKSIHSDTEKWSKEIHKNTLQRQQEVDIFYKQIEANNKIKQRLCFDCHQDNKEINNILEKLFDVIYKNSYQSGENKKNLERILNDNIYFNLARDDAQFSLSLKVNLNTSKEFSFYRAEQALKYINTCINTVISPTEYAHTIRNATKNVTRNAIQVDKIKIHLQAIFRSVNNVKKVFIISPRKIKNDIRSDSLVDIIEAIVPPPDAQHCEKNIYSDNHSAIQAIALSNEEIHDIDGHTLVLTQSADRMMQKLQKNAEIFFNIKIKSFDAILRLTCYDINKFIQFSKEYAAGNIIKKRDEREIQQWFSKDKNCYLTTSADEENPSLAVAAAQYISILNNPTLNNTVKVNNGEQAVVADFSLLDNWLHNMQGFDTEIQTLILIKLVLDRPDLVRGGL